MRPLVLILSAVIVVDTMFYTALAPLLPHFASEYGLSKGGAGFLSGIYAAGVLAASVPGGIAASRLGAKWAVLLGTALTAAASLAFGLATDIWTLSIARFAQGIGSACSWAGALAWVVAVAAPGRRGTVIGTTMGAAVFGALLGPALGALATVAGVRATFIAVSAGGFALAALVLGITGAPAHPQPLSALRRADARLFGVLNVLVPLKLHGHGWSGAAIGALFFTTATLEMALNPLIGRFTDRRGFLVPVRLALLASIAISLALAWADAAALVAALAVAAGIGYGAFFTPGMALVSVSAEQRGIALGIAFGVMNGAWAVGNAIGPAAGGALAQAAGDSLPYLLLAGICLATLAATRAYLQPRSRPSSS